MALIRDAIRIDGWARAQHATHTTSVRPEWCPLCERDATIFTGYTLSAGVKTWHFTDDRDALPPDLRSFRELNMRARDAKVQFAIHEIERDGERVCWQVGDDHYETPERGPEPPSPAAVQPRPRYRLTPGGIVPCQPAPITSPIVHSATTIPTSPAHARTASRVARRSMNSGTAAHAAIRGTTTKRKRAGTLGALLDRLEALGATFCPECYAYLWPEHTHLTRGPVVPVAHCQLAEAVVVDGLDGQTELVTMQEEEAA